MNLSKLWEIVKQREAWRAAVHRVTKSQTQLSNWTTTLILFLLPDDITVVCVCVHAKSLHSCPALWDTTDCSLPGSSVHGTFQARILQWIAISFSRGSSWPRNRTGISCIASGFLTNWAIREAPNSTQMDFIVNNMKQEMNTFKEAVTYSHRM